jgi:hypothetical protein
MREQSRARLLSRERIAMAEGRKVEGAGRNNECTLIRDGETARAR